MGGARNCLFVGVAQDRVVLIPHFPFTLFFLPEIYRLEHDIPLANVTTVTPRRFLFQELVRVEYSDPSGQSRIVELKLRHPDGFLTSVRGRGGVAT